MCAAAAYPPIREPQHYTPIFKVEVCLSQPLWGTIVNPLHEVTSLCGVLELLCKKEAARLQKDTHSGRNLSVVFKDKAQLILEQLHTLSASLPGGLINYIDRAQLVDLYPRAVTFIMNPEEVPDVSWTAMYDHLDALSAFQRVHGMAQQLNSDIKCLSNHKYIAHQLALLHQSLSSLSKVSYMADFKQNVESQFPTIKQCINEDADNGSTPHLPQEQQLWLQDLTAQILHVCNHPPQEIVECLHPVMNLVIKNM